MSKKDEKKKQRLQERLTQLEQELTTALTKKSSATTEINVPEYTRRIQELREQLAKM